MPPGWLADDGRRFITKRPGLLVPLPDLNDPATLGCLLALAREAWGDPTLHAIPGGSPGDAARGLWWEIRGAKRRWYTGSYPTEPAALIAAVLAAPPPGSSSAG